MPKMSLTMCAFHTDPGIWLTPYMPPEALSSAYTTSSVPTGSPDTPENAQQTQQEVADSELRLIDLNDTYSVVVTSSTEALLIKPGRRRQQEHVARVAMAEGDVREVVRQFRGLATLGAITSCDDGRNAIAPWHVNYVERVCTALDSLL